MYSSKGTVHYDITDGPWVTVSIDQQLVDYYFFFIPKYYHVIRPRWKAHATVVRPEDNPSLKNWGKHEGEIINFIYDPTILYGEGFWWVNLWSVAMENIRKELDLSIKSRITISPPGYSKVFHCTIGKNRGF